MPDQKVHEGRMVKHFREILEIKQDTLALDLGLTQKAVSPLDQKGAIYPALLELIPRTLKVLVEAIKNFNEAESLNYIAKNFNGNLGKYTDFNPIEKVVELLQRLLPGQREKVEMLKMAIERKQ